MATSVTRPPIQLRSVTTVSAAAQLTALPDVAPAACPAGGGVAKDAAGRGQADGSDLAVDVDRGAELHQGDVVVEQGVVVLGVLDDLADATAHLVWVVPRGRLVLSAQEKRVVACGESGVKHSAGCLGYSKITLILDVLEPQHQTNPFTFSHLADALIQSDLQ